MHPLSTRDDLAQHHDVIEQLLVSSSRVSADDLAAGGIFVSYATTKQTKFTAQTVMNLPACSVALRCMNLPDAYDTPPDNAMIPTDNSMRLSSK